MERERMYLGTSEDKSKSSRLLQLYTRFEEGKIVRKPEMAQKFQVTERSVQRDIDDLRCFFREQTPAKEIIYDRSVKGYRLKENTALLDNSEILAVCKILLESRSMVKKEMLPILERLVTCCVPEKNRKAVEELIGNEKVHYIEPHHKKLLLPDLWEIGQAVQNHQVAEIEYERLKEPKLVKRRIEPVGIMFSEYYFYLTAFLQDVDKETEFENKNDLFPTIYRIDRIQSFRVLDKKFEVPYAGRFEEGEFRKRIQFMYGGKLERIRFRYTGPSLEAVLDRLPTATVINQDEAGWIVSAEVFGKGAEMWLRSQGDYVEMVK